jgi:TPR repeat protein
MPNCHQSTFRARRQNLILWLFTAILITAGCSSTPTFSNDSEQFIAAKEAFLKHQYVLAATLLEPLSIKGNDQAQYTLGYLYYYGLGVTKNSELAKKWIISSASKGNKMALKALDLVTQNPQGNADEKFNNPLGISD